MSREHDEQTIALAAMFQVATLVDQIATRGMVPQHSLESSIYSLFVDSPNITAAVFGGVSSLPKNLGMGIKTLSDLVEKKGDVKNNNITNYVLSLMMLQSKVRKTPGMLETISDRLDDIREKTHYFSPDVSNPMDEPSAFTHSSIIANIANLYQDTISTFNFRIQVSGDPRHLQNAENAAKIRALLLAGVRAAILWNQVGGKRWHMLFFRSRIRPSLQKIR